ENPHIVASKGAQMTQTLTYRIRRALVPRRIIRCLLSCQNVHKGRAECTKMIGVLDMAVQRCRIELCQDEHPADTRVQAIGDRNVYESIFPGDRHGWLRTTGRQRI